MARYEDLTVRLAADDKLSAPVRDAADDVERLDKMSADVTIDADDKASGELRDVARRADDLDGKSADIKVSASGLDDVVGKLDALPGALGDVAGMLSGGAGLAAGAGGVAAALFAAADSAAAMAIDAKTTADLTGATVEDASRLQAVWSSSGADINDLNDVLLQMNGVLQTSPELARQIGVNLNDGKDVASRFVEVVEAIQSSTGTAAEKAQMMAQVFGEEGVRQVGKLTTLVGTDLQAAMDGVADTRVMSDADVAKAIEFEQAMAAAKAQIAAVAQEIGQSVIPVVSELAGLLSTDMPGTDRSIIGFSTAKLTEPLDRFMFGIEGIQRTLGMAEGDNARFWSSVVAGSDEASEAIDHGFGTVAVDALGAAAGSVDDVNAALHDLTDELDVERATARFREAFARAMKQSQDGVALTGSDIVGLKDDILSVAQYAALTPAEVRALLKRVDQGDLAGVVGDVNNRLAANPPKVPVDATMGQVVSGAAIAAAVGAVRVPVDTFLRSVISQQAIVGAIGGAVRLTGTREG